MQCLHAHTTAVFTEGEMAKQKISKWPTNIILKHNGVIMNKHRDSCLCNTSCLVFL